MITYDRRVVDSMMKRQNIRSKKYKRKINKVWDTVRLVCPNIISIWEQRTGKEANIRHERLKL